VRFTASARTAAFAFLKCRVRRKHVQKGANTTACSLPPASLAAYHRSTAPPIGTQTPPRTAGTTVSCLPQRPAQPPWPTPSSESRLGRKCPAPACCRRPLPLSCRRCRRRPCVGGEGGAERDSEHQPERLRTATGRNALRSTALHEPRRNTEAHPAAAGAAPSAAGPVFRPVCVALAARLPPPRRLALLPPHSPQSTS